VRSRNSARRPGSRSRRAGVRGVGRVHSRKSRFVPRDIERTTKRETRHSATNEPPPLSQPLPRNPSKRAHPGRKKQARCLRSQGFGGRGEIGRNADPGPREGFLPLAGPGLFSAALTGLSVEAAVSCRVTSGRTSNPQIRARTPVPTCGPAVCSRTYETEYEAVYQCYNCPHEKII